MTMTFLLVLCDWWPCFAYLYNLFCTRMVFTTHVFLLSVLVFFCRSWLLSLMFLCTRGVCLSCVSVLMFSLCDFFRLCFSVIAGFLFMFFLFLWILSLMFFSYSRVLLSCFFWIHVFSTLVIFAGRVHVFVTHVFLLSWDFFVTHDFTVYIVSEVIVFVVRVRVFLRPCVIVFFCTPGFCHLIFFVLMFLSVTFFCGCAFSTRLPVLNWISFVSSRCSTCDCDCISLTCLLFFSCLWSYVDNRQTIE